MISIHDIEPFRFVKSARRLLRPIIDKLEEIAKEEVGDDLKMEVLQSLGKIGDKSSLSILQESFDQYDDFIEPITALGLYKSSTPVPKLIERLEDPDALFKEEVVRVLGEIGDPMAMRNMMQLLYDEDRMVRYYAAWALYHTGGRDVVQSLCGLLNDPDEWIVINVLDILSRLKDSEAIPALVGQFEIARDSRLKAIIISSLSSFAEGKLLKTFEAGLASFDPRIQANSVEAIAGLKIPGSEMKRKLKKFYGHPNNRVRANLCIALAKIEPDKVKNEVLVMLRSKDAATRRSAAYILSRVAIENRDDYIHRLLKDENFGVRKMALQAALKLQGKLGVQEIMPLLKDDSPWVRKQAVECAEKLEDFPNEAVQEIFATEKNSAVVESLLKFFIARNMKETISLIFDRIKKEHEEELPWLISALGHLGAVEELGKVKRFLGPVRSEVFAEYYQALMQNGNLAIIEEITAAINEKKRETELISWVGIVGELGAFFKDTEKYSLALKEALGEEVAKDMEGIAGFEISDSRSQSLSFEDGVALFNNKDYLKAKEFFEDYVKDKPENLDGNYYLANSFYYLGEQESAVKILEDLNRSAPSHLPSAILLGQIYFRKKEWRKLTVCYEKTRQFITSDDKKNTIRVLGALGLGYFHQKRYEEAIESLNVGLKANPRDLSSSYHLALCHYATGNTSMAREILNNLKKTLPKDSQVLKNVLDLLQRIEVSA